MLATIIGAVLQAVIAPLFGYLLTLHNQQVAQQLGQTQQAVTDEAAQVVASANDAQQVAATVQAENASLARSVAYPSSLRDPGDPDSRD